jgi:3-hydroxymyristoyl/3-hydroxydecanoyl-(acyl carrier protein) dehydratase
MPSSHFVVSRLPDPSPEGEVVLRVEVPRDLVFFEGHFEGNPMLPGVAQVVALVDAEARRTFASLASRGARGLSRLKFQATIRPGDVLQLGLALEPGTEPRVRFRIDRVAADATERATSGVLAYGAEPTRP